MANLTLRNIKGDPLTFDEMDSNLLALDSDSPWNVAASFITYEGQVGIGSGAWPPTYTLDFGNGDSSVASIGTRNAAFEVHVDGPYPFEIITNGVERFTVTTDGKVGINEPNPAEPLDVVGNIQTTTTFIGNQAYCNSFYDGTMTISGGTIFNAVGGNFSGRIRFGSLRDDSGTAISRFGLTVTNTNSQVPTSAAVYNYVADLNTSLSSQLDSVSDSAYAWNAAEHQALNDRLDSLSDSLTAEIIARNNSDSDFTARMDSAYDWNVAEHTAIRDTLNAEIVARKNSDSDFTDRLDSAYAWNVSEHQALSDSITTEMIARSNADSDISASIIPIIDSALISGIIALDCSPSGGVSDDF